MKIIHARQDNEQKEFSALIWVLPLGMVLFCSAIMTNDNHSITGLSCKERSIVLIVITPLYLDDNDRSIWSVKNEHFYS